MKMKLIYYRRNMRRENMNYHFTVNGKLPSLNEVIAKNRTNKYAGAKYKKDIETLIITMIKTAQRAGTIKPINEPCEIYIYWNEQTKRRDVDNIQSAQKFILDALVRSGILIDDCRKYKTNMSCNARF